MPVISDTRPGRVRTPPGKKSTSARLGDMPGGTSDGSSSVIHEPNTLSGRGENVSIDMIFRGTPGELWEKELFSLATATDLLLANRTQVRENHMSKELWKSKEKYICIPQ